MANVQHLTAQFPGSIELAYIDSGPVPGSSDYTTVVLIHGSAFNANTFEKLHSLSHNRNLRTIAVQRRDYPGSTPYTDTELQSIKDGRKEFIDDVGLLYSNFVHYLSTHNDIPKPSLDGQSGGIVLLGWSFGTATALSVLFEPKSIPQDVRESMEVYLRKVVIYDPPHIAIGQTLPPGTFYDPFQDTSGTRTLEDMYRDFNRWVSMYAKNPKDWKGDTAVLDHGKIVEASTVDSWTAEDSKKYFDVQVGVRSEFNMYIEPMQTVLRELARRALFDQEMAQTFLPGVSTALISVGRSNWHCMWGSFMAHQLYQEHVAQGEKIRPMKVAHVEQGNHFAHFDHPEEFLDAVQEVLN